LFKHLQEFDGKGSYEAWRTNTKRFLDDSLVPEKIKLRALLHKIRGEAQEDLEGTSVQSIEEVFKLLNPIYGKDPRTTRDFLKQSPDESVKNYSMKFKRHLRRMNQLVDSSSKDFDYFQETSRITFISGLLPSLRYRVEGIAPTTLDDAIHKAIQLENSNTFEAFEKKTKPSIPNIVKLNTVAENKSNDNIIHGLNHLNSQFKLLNRNTNNLLKKHQISNKNMSDNAIRYKCYG